MRCHLLSQISQLRKQCLYPGALKEIRVIQRLKPDTLVQLLSVERQVKLYPGLVGPVDFYAQSRPVKWPRGIVDNVEQIEKNLKKRSAAEVAGGLKLLD